MIHRSAPSITRRWCDCPADSHHRLSRPVSHFFWFLHDQRAPAIALDKPAVHVSTCALNSWKYDGVQETRDTGPGHLACVFDAKPPMQHCATSGGQCP